MRISGLSLTAPTSTKTHGHLRHRHGEASSTSVRSAPPPKLLLACPLLDHLLLVFMNNKTLTSGPTWDPSCVN